MTATKPSTSPSPTSSSSSSSSSSATPHTKNVFRLHGVNVLNRKNVDSIARLTALERRRATHILDERQRRDTMNQLLTELAGLVRESEMEAAQQPQQPQQPPPPPTPPTPTLHPDGTEKRPPVKSNSITTLRNAIAEIRRLRAHIGTQQQQQQQPRQPIHHHHEDSPSRRRSSASSTTPSLLDLDLTSLSTLAELASQHCSGSDSNPASYNSTPMSSPKSTSVRTLSPVASEAMGGGYSHHGSCGESPSEASSSSNQLYSPPLSPSSPTSIQNHFSITLPMMNPVFSDNGICSSSNRQTATLPPLHTIVQSTSLMYHSQQQQQQQPQHLSLSIGTHMQTTQMELSPSSSSPGDPEVLSPGPYLQELLSIAQSPSSHTSNPPFPPL
jgi:hypothetical protein